jgi:hypothetical protein
LVKEELGKHKRLLDQRINLQNNIEDKEDNCVLT